MILNQMMPRSVWIGPLPSDNVSASESHLYSDCKQELWQPLLCQGVLNYPVIDWFWNNTLSQWISQHTMDNQHWFQDMAADSGDEAYKAEDIYGDCFPVADTSTPYARSQTTAAGVSAVNVGRDFGPSHLPHNKEPAGNEQMFLSNLPTANGYGRGFGANYDNRQYSWQTYNTTGGNQTLGYLDCTDGLPSNPWQPSLPVFGEPLDAVQVSPNSFSSSVPSSATSEAMASMNLDTMAAHGNTPVNPRVNSSVSGSFSGSDNSGSTWASSYPSTISPKMLRIHPSPTHTSSSESIQTSMLASVDSDLGPTAFENRHTRSPFHSLRPPQKPRKELPNKPGRPRTVPLPSPEPSSSKGKRPALPQGPSIHPPSTQKSKAAHIKQENHDEMPCAVEGPSAHGRGSTRIPDGARSAKDDFLVRSKLSGMTYREIRRKGNFTEAESTLRGRFRTLTKDKEARVRKPEWQDNDIRLLKKAVRKLNRGDEIMPTKTPWGQIADYIIEHGGSYHFGSATCHRKWKELVEEGKAGISEFS
ncbi:hypothetical protein F5Y06DRAFT_293308 [Hypoxylon sp. FL0890]|nr:hypothetical protein F5Y06DRAFT_293308 [Hypoxylon sp. FL0890]